MVFMVKTWFVTSLLQTCNKPFNNHVKQKNQTTATSSVVFII